MPNMTQWQMKCLQGMAGEIKIAMSVRPKSTELDRPATIINGQDRWDNNKTVLPPFMQQTSQTRGRNNEIPHMTQKRSSLEEV